MSDTKALVVSDDQKSVAPFTSGQIEVLRKSHFKNFTDDEMAYSLAVCARTGLDPFAKQIHFQKRRDKNEDRIITITGIDGFRLSAARTKEYAGSDEPLFELKNERPVKASVTVYRIVQGQRVGFTASARWEEFYPGDGTMGFMWRKMPYQMLGKTAECQALRKAFPVELSGIYSKEEMDQSASDNVVIPTKGREVAELLELTATERPAFEADLPSEKEQTTGDYVFKTGAGKRKGKTVGSFPNHYLVDTLAWFDGEKKNGKTFPQEVEEDMFYIKAHLESGNEADTN